MKKNVSRTTSGDNGCEYCTEDKYHAFMEVPFLSDAII
jgi:hypothetical protein